MEITDGISREREAGKIPCLASAADSRPWAKIGGGEGGIVLFALQAFLFFCDYFFIFPNQGGRARAALWVCSCCNFGLSFLHLVSSYFQSTFTESSRVETRILERVVDDPVESWRVVNILYSPASIRFTSGKHDIGFRLRLDFR